MSELEELKRLLFREESADLRELKHRVLDVEQRSDDTASVLPESIRHSDPERLAAALEEPVERCITRAVTTRREMFANALYPVIGPAIRKSIAATLAELLRDINEVIEQSTSAQGLRWRWESWRTGMPFSEVVLRHTLLYRVELAMLVHRHSGLLLGHAAMAGTSLSADSDAVSAMITAIQDFVHDSFRRGEGADLDTVNIGDDTVWLIHGPQALLVCVVRGVASQSLRAKLQTALEEIHVRFGSLLDEFAGDRAALAGLDEELAKCLLVKTTSREAHRSRRLSPALIVVVVLLAAALGWWLWQAHARAQRLQSLLAQLEGEPGIVVLSQDLDRDPAHVQLLRDPLASSPQAHAATHLRAGESVSFSEAPFQSLETPLVERRARQALEIPPQVSATLDGASGLLRLEGKASPEWVQRIRATVPAIAGVTRIDHTRLEVDPGALIARARALLAVPGSVDVAYRAGVLVLTGVAPVDWIESVVARGAETDLPPLEPVALAAEPESVIARLRAQADTPDTAWLSLDGDVLRLHGAATRAWQERVQALAIESRWVTRVDASALQLAQAAELKGLAQRVDGARLMFSAGTTLTATADNELVRLAAALKRMQALTRANGQSIHLTVTGYSDGLGSASDNQDLRERRARSVRARLVAAGIDPGLVSAVAAALPQGDVPPHLDPDLRRVQLSLQLSDVPR